MLNKFHKKDNFFLIILLAIPPLTPLSFIPGFSVLFGSSIALICCQLLMGRKKIWLPSILKNKKIPHDINQGLLKIIPYVEFLEKYIKKRAKFLSSSIMRYFFILVILILSILLMLPIPYVDLISASAITAIAIGIIKRDGLLMISTLLLIIIYIYSFLYFTHSFSARI